MDETDTERIARQLHQAATWTSGPKAAILDRLADEVAALDVAEKPAAQAAPAPAPAPAAAPDPKPSSGAP